MIVSAIVVQKMTCYVLMIKAVDNNEQRMFHKSIFIRSERMIEGKEFLFLFYGILAIAILFVIGKTIVKQIDSLIVEIKRNNEILTSIRREMEKNRTGEWPSD